MRLITSLANAAAVLDAWAADRLDAWAENQAPTDAPRETPLGFTPATGTDAPDPVAVVNARAAGGLTGEQRTRWLAEVNGRLDASTGGPWCTEERDRPTGRIHSPYGVIATGVTREADRDLIENARADLYGLLALAEHDDDVIAAWGKAADAQAARRHEAERELEGMEHRLRAVDMVAAAWADGSLKGYRYRVGPDEPAGRVIAAIEGITSSRGKTIRDLQSQVEATQGELAGMNQREADVERVLDAVVDGRLKLAEYVDPETPAGRVRDLVDTLLKQVRDAEARADLAERKLDAHHRHDAASAEYTPGPFAAAILATGGTIVVDDQGDPHVADIALGVPTGPGTLITADGKRHRFTGGTASPVDDHIIGGGGGGALIPDDTLIAAAGGYGTANSAPITVPVAEFVSDAIDAEKVEGNDDE